VSKKLTLADWCSASKRLNCEVAKIRAVAQVESRGSGFLSDGRVVILFERHHFRRFTNGIYDNSHPQISNKNPGGYFGNENEYHRFNEAFSLNAKAAMLSCSWGKFQIMGFNYAICGFWSINDFVDAMKISEGEQLEAFCGFVEHNNLDDELRRGDWAGFARGYNGKNYKINNYDVKMKNAFDKFKFENIDCNQFETTPENVSAVIDSQTIGGLAPVQTITTGNTVQTNSPQTPPTTDQPTQIAENITNVSTGETPAPVFVPEDKIQDAPPKENSTSDSVKMTLYGITVPTFMAVVIKAITDAISQGFISAAEIGTFIFGLVKDNLGYLLLLIGLIIVGMMLKKLWKQITMWITMWINTDPTRHNIEVKPK